MSLKYCNFLKNLRVGKIDKSENIENIENTDVKNVDEKYFECKISLYRAKAL